MVGIRGHLGGDRCRAHQGLPGQRCRLRRPVLLPFRWATDRFLHARIGSCARGRHCPVLTVAFRRRASYDLSRPNARPWLYGIAVNLMRDHRRTEERRLSAYAAARPTRKKCSSTSPRQGLTERRRGAAGADPSDRHSSCCSVGSALLRGTCRGIESPAGTVRSRLSRTRSKLRTTLAVLDTARFPRVTGVNEVEILRRELDAIPEPDDESVAVVRALSSGRSAPPRHRSADHRALAPDYRSCRRCSRRVAGLFIVHPGHHARIGTEIAAAAYRALTPPITSVTKIFRTNGLLTERWYDERSVRIPRNDGRQRLHARALRVDVV